METDLLENTHCLKNFHSCFKMDPGIHVIEINLNVKNILNDDIQLSVS